MRAVAALRLAGFRSGRGDCARGGRSARRGGSRAGLGLAIAREVVLRHHGDMRAENGESGLRVTVTLPVLQERLTIGEE